MARNLTGMGLQPGRVVLISAAAALGGFLSGWVARIVKSWPDRSWPAGQGTGQGLAQARRPGPERDPEISAKPAHYRRARPWSLSEQKTKQNPDGTVPVDGLTRLVVTRPGELARPGRKKERS